jgi:hypothetical protein
MRKIVLSACFAILTIALALNSGCKKSGDSFDITDGSWAFYLQSGPDSSSLVYAFRGTKEAGNVYYSNENRGIYTVSGSLVNFTVSHYDVENLEYLYTYTGTHSDYYNMTGSFTVKYPNGTIINGTWQAER